MAFNQQAQHGSAGDGPDRGTVEVGHLEPGLAVVTMRGEHDLSTMPLLRPAFERATAHSNVLVDLSDCSFIDSTVVTLLIKAEQTVQTRDEELVLVIPPQQRVIARVAEVLHLSECFPIDSSRDVALARLQHATHLA